LAKNSIGAKAPVADFVADAFDLAGARFGAFAAFAASIKTALGSKAALLCRRLMTSSTNLRLLPIQSTSVFTIEHFV
jgi:hypothetical protein